MTLSIFAGNAKRLEMLHPTRRRYANGRSQDYFSDFSRWAVKFPN